MPLTKKLLRSLNRFVGRGPWRVTPFATVAAQRTDEAGRGVHRAESFAGIVRHEPDDGFFYSTRVSLLGQPESGEVLPDGHRYLEGGVCPAAAKLLYTLTDAGIAGRDGVVYCPRTRIAVVETVRCWTSPAHEHPLLSAVRFPPAVKLSGLSLSLATLDAEGFYHFLLESLPRLALVRERLAMIDNVLVSGARSAGTEAWLALAGVPAGKLRWLHPLAHYHCAQLLFTNRLTGDCQPTPWVRDALRATFRAPQRPTGDRWLWISRADARSRHIAWEDQLLALLPKFEKVSLSALAPADQVDLFSQAKVVAGAHGAGLSNLIFAPPGVCLVEFFPDARSIPLYGRVVQ